MMGKSKKLRRLIKSAIMGKPHEMYRLGIEYQLGQHLSQDMEKACFWITQAAEYGHADAMEWLKNYYFDDNAEIQANA